jgi:hypothetical protein
MCALEEAMSETGLTRATIITSYESETINTGSGHIEVVPAWRWFLQATAPGLGSL